MKVFRSSHLCEIRQCIRAFHKASKLAFGSESSLAFASVSEELLISPSGHLLMGLGIWQCIRAFGDASSLAFWFWLHIRVKLSIWQCIRIFYDASALYMHLVVHLGFDSASGHLVMHQLSINFGSELGLLFDLFCDASTFAFVNVSGHLAVHKSI